MFSVRKRKKSSAPGGAQAGDAGMAGRWDAPCPTGQSPTPEPSDLGKLSAGPGESGLSAANVPPQKNLPSVAPKGWKHAALVWIRMIRFENTLLPLAFAYLGAFFATTGSGLFFPPLWVLVWLTVAMTGLRFFSLTLNHLADLDLDRLSVQAAGKALVTGEISVNAARVFAFLSVLAYFAGCLFLNQLALILSPVPVLVVIACAWAKRRTWLTHFLLGLNLGFAPIAGWISVDPHITLPAVLFSCAVLFRVAGNDMIAATRQVDFDTACRLRSAPVCFGVTVAFLLADLCYAVFTLFLFLAFWSMGFAIWGVALWLLAGSLLLGERRLIRSPGHTSAEPAKRRSPALAGIDALITGLIFGGALLALYL